MPRILIVRVCALGDFVVNAPALAAAQRKFADASFTLVGNPSSLVITRDFVKVDAIHSIELQPWARLFYEPIPDLDFDAAVVWMKDPALTSNLAASGVPNVVRADPFPAFGHAADHLLRTLHLQRPPLPDLWRPQSDDIVVHAGSGSPKKNWPYYEDLLRRLPSGRALPQDRSLGDLSRYLRTVRCFIGNDSGLTHLAAYSGCPTVALFGPTDPRMWGPIGRRVRIVWKRRLEDISVDEVLGSIYSLGAVTS